MKKWEQLPSDMQTEEIRPYYEVLRRKRCSLFFKRVFDIFISALMLIALSPLFFVLAVAIKIDSRGPVFYRQERITRYGKKFRIFKFRTMIQDADKIGTQVTINNDKRITRVGKFIRKCRLDEVAQLIDVFRGKMTFVGVRPEVPKYVAEYTSEMKATLLLLAGVTNLTSIYYKDEDKLLASAENADKVYLEEILPQKMEWNLKGIKNFSFWNDIKLMFMTTFAVLGKNCRNSIKKNRNKVNEKDLFLKKSDK